jgi:predicted nucleic acid-binding protein
MSAKTFFDTSVLVYVVTKSDWRAPIAAALLRAGGVISIQVLNEFVNVSRKKMRQDWDAIKQDLEDIRHLCDPVLPVTLATHEEGLRIAQRYNYRVYDSLMIASAIESGCSTLLSEDMQDGQIIGSLTIRNPFAAP